MEIHAMHGDKMTHILTTHRSEDDNGPVQMVSAKQLAYLQRIEQLFLELLETLAKAELHQPITQPKK